MQRSLAVDRALAQACLAFGGEPQPVPEECRRLQQDSDIAVLSGHLSVLGGRRGVCAEIMILWDRKALDFMHFETLYYVIGLLLQRLVRLCDTQ